ncbi:vesicle coat protein [Hypoxylon rubiginosum]|uniref:Vesicle coat protein n=1 Tax=Hypoxylon rubiginosum TaxID=110542 RepID=A0ACC0CSR3_9PEZI|nr:vesicle coat protein [Hypoxylon rubiginosum]
MTSILCLAHYCDVHGPTPLMVTEGLPVPCRQCCDDDAEMLRPQTSAAATNASQATVADALRKMTLGAPRSSSTPVSDQDAQAHRASLLRTAKTGPGSTAPPVTAASPTTASAIQTPPQSPRNAPESFPESSGKAGLRRDSSFRRTYDDYVTKRANPCQNCALTLPKRQDPKNAKNESTATASGSKPDLHGPTLRTRAPYARVYGGNGEFSPPESNPQSSCVSDAEDDTLPGGGNRSNAHRRPTTSTSRSSISSRSSVTQHTHYLDYTSTHEPVAPTTYSVVRSSCLRTLSFETLPRRPESAQSNQSLSSPGIPPSFQSSISRGPGFITTVPNPQSVANGGPILFGDREGGYTTAYIFRIPDVHARGRMRVYAFLALSTHRERLAMKTFSFLSAAFRDLANWIQELAEAEAEREREREEANSPVAAINAAYGYGGFSSDGPRDSGIGLGLGGGFGPNLDRERERDNTSSFLTGGGRGGFVQRMGGSMGPGGFAPKARGLAEVVGLPDFFIELHSRFVQLLLELGVVLSP